MDLSCFSQKFLFKSRYVLALKGNQGLLSRQVEDWFQQAIAHNWQGIEYGYHETVDSSHHRIETRQVWTVSVSQLPPLHRQNQWLGLTTVVMVRSRRCLRDVLCVVRIARAEHIGSSA